MNAPFPLTALGAAANSLLNSGAALRAGLYRAGWLPQRRLHAKVVSVGNIAWGGTGKTPFVIWLADRLTASGLRVSVLTRGYRRTSSEPVRVLSPGTDPADASHEGDEVQLYLRHLRNVPVGISASRFDAGRQMEEQLPLEVHLLDDGFQHLSLARDVDIVLVDAANPWGARVGLSRLLRESPRALRRASAIVLTRCEALEGTRDGTTLATLQATLRKLNPNAPQFLASTRLLRFVSSDDASACSPDDMRGRGCVAFCGIASPAQFLALLEKTGIQYSAHKFFCDHHRYSSGDAEVIERLVRDAKADSVITTEKDLVNLGEQIRFSVPLYWAEIATAVEHEDALLAWLGQRLRLPLSGTRGANEQQATAALGGTA